MGRVAREEGVSSKTSMKKLKGWRGRPLGRSSLGLTCGAYVGVGGGGTAAEDQFIQAPEEYQPELGF